jgi:hypothetical protein
MSFTFDHRTLKTRLPVRSALFKQRTGGLVVRWVTTGESPLLNVFDGVFVFCPRNLAECDWARPPCNRSLKLELLHVQAQGRGDFKYSVLAYAE